MWQETVKPPEADDLFSDTMERLTEHFAGSSEYEESAVLRMDDGLLVKHGDHFFTVTVRVAEVRLVPVVEG